MKICKAFCLQIVCKCGDDDRKSSVLWPLTNWHIAICC